MSWARILITSSNSILKPSDGRLWLFASQDMIIGLFHLTSSRGSEERGHAFSSVCLRSSDGAMDRHEIELYTKNSP